MTEIERAILQRHVPESGRDVVLHAAVNTRCRHCRERVALADRSIQHVLGSDYVFHKACARVGPIQMRVEARSPSALRQRRALRADITAAKNAWV